jgi:hypothetical protein
VAPSPSNLHLPVNIAPDAIAACRNADQSSDLHALASGKLYYFQSTNQRNESTAFKVAKSTAHGRKELIRIKCRLYSHNVVGSELQ